MVYVLGVLVIILAYIVVRQGIALNEQYIKLEEKLRLISILRKGQDEESL